MFIEFVEMQQNVLRRRDNDNNVKRTTQDNNKCSFFEAYAVLLEEIRTKYVIHD